MVGVLVVVCLLGVFSGYFEARRSPPPSKTASSVPLQNVHQIVAAMQRYHDANGKLPDTYSIDAAGRPLLSWRVHLLPYLGYQDLYSQIKLNESWDSTQNKALWDQMPDVYKSPDLDAGAGETGFVVITGADAVFRIGRPRSLSQISDDLSKTIMLAETAQTRNWMEPSDLDMNSLNLRIAGDPPSIGHDEAGGAVVGFVDGSSGTLPLDLDPEVLRALITCTGGENVR